MNGFFLFLFTFSFFGMISYEWGLGLVLVMACRTAVRIKVQAQLAQVWLMCCCLSALGPAWGVKVVLLCLFSLINIKFL